MPILLSYLARLFFGWLLLIATALTSILLAFDLLSNVVAVTANHTHTLKPILHYSLLRLPAILSLSLPLASLLASLVTVIKLLGAHELTAIGAAGWPIGRITRILLVCSLLPALLHAGLVNYVLPVTGPQLLAWSKDDYRGAPKSTPVLILDRWLSSGDLIVHIGGLSANRKEITDLIALRRTDNGTISDFIKAPRARFIDDAWQLDQPGQTIDAQGQTHDIQALPSPLPWTPAALSLIGGTLDTLGLDSLFKLYRAKDVASGWLLSLWIQWRLAEPLMSIIMVALGSLLAFQPPRNATTWKMTSTLIAIGFGYFIGTRVLLSLGETALLPPITAIWLFPVLFGMGCSWMLLKQE